MNRPEFGPLAIIVAVTEPVAEEFLPRLVRFVEEAGPNGEVIVVDASGASNVVEMSPRFNAVRVLNRPLGRLAPHLWRDGLLATDKPLIAFTTAQMILSPGWRNALLHRLDESKAAGVGGPIKPGQCLSNTDRAVALLRYSSYFPPLINSATVEPPGDNALYRREALETVAFAWADGFWEVNVHRELRRRGEILEMSDRAVAAFEGGTGLREIALQRVQHATRYGADRSRGFTRLARLIRVVASPLVPPLLCMRIALRLRSLRMPLSPWLGSLPGLALLASAWGLGEAVGTWQGPTIGQGEDSGLRTAQLT